MKQLMVENLDISLTSSGQKLVEGISFSLEKGDRLGIIGESGSGKSITALALLGLLVPGMKAAGSITLGGVPVLESSERELMKLRGSKAAMVFQEPLSALDPLMKIGRQISGPLKRHQRLEGEAAKKEVISLMERVQLRDPPRIAGSYPHELSGGERQRAAIAMALACKPELLIADEPTTALDVTVQDEVLTLLNRLVDEEGMSLIFITHDLPVVARVANQLLVMKDGRVVEINAVARILDNPQHPAARKLLEAARRVTTVPYIKERAGLT